MCNYFNMCKQLRQYAVSKCKRRGDYDEYLEPKDNDDVAREKKNELYIFHDDVATNFITCVIPDREMKT